MSGFPLPAKLLQRIAELPGIHRGIALCPDFAVENWRYKQLAEHLFDWLPDVALRPKERISLLYEPNKTLAGPVDVYSILLIPLKGARSGRYYFTLLAGRNLELFHL